MEAITICRVWLPARGDDRADADDESHAIRKHVRGVGHDGDGVGDVAADELGNHEEKADYGDSDQLIHGI